MRLTPFLHFELEEAAFCTLDWGNSELIAAGLLHFHYFGHVWSITQGVLGVIAVYNLGRALRSPSECKQPFRALIQTI